MLLECSPCSLRAALRTRHGREGQRPERAFISAARAQCWGQVGSMFPPHLCLGKLVEFVSSQGCLKRWLQYCLELLTCTSVVQRKPSRLPRLYFKQSCRRGRGEWGMRNLLQDLAGAGSYELFYPSGREEKYPTTFLWCVTHKSSLTRSRLSPSSLKCR